jgi:hypothetical protein
VRGEATILLRFLFVRSTGGGYHRFIAAYERRFVFRCVVDVGMERSTRSACS